MVATASIAAPITFAAIIVFGVVAFWLIERDLRDKAKGWQRVARDVKPLVQDRIWRERARRSAYEGMPK